MAIDLHTSLPSQFIPNEDHHHHLSPSHNNNRTSASQPLSQAQRNSKNDDFIAELTHRMAHSMLPDDDDDTFDFSAIGSHSQNSESSWELNHGSPEGSSQEPSPPATPQDCYWKSNYDMFGTFEKMKLDERESPKYNPGYEKNYSSKSNTGLCSYQSLIQEQIRAIELSRLRQDHVLSPRPEPAPYRKSQGPPSEPKQKVQEFPKKGNGRRARPPRPGPQQAGAGMRALFLDGPGSRGGTGVFLPRGGPTAPSESTHKQGNGCSTVLIPARVVQALQLHFDQMAATSGPRAGGFPPLHDVLVSNRDGMYSLQKRQSRKAQASIQNDTILPQEWTY